MNSFTGTLQFDSGIRQEFHIMDANTSLQVKRSSRTFGFWLNQSCISDDLRRQLTKANVLIVPQLGYLDYEGPLFPTATEEFFHFLREHKSDEFAVDICIDDSCFKSLVRFHDDLYLATAIIMPVVGPIFAHYVKRFIDSKLGTRASKTRIKSEVVIENRETTGESTRVSYEGLASDYDEYVGSTLRLVTSTKDLKLLTETEDMDHEERIQHLSEHTGN